MQKCYAPNKSCNSEYSLRYLTLIFGFTVPQYVFFALYVTFLYYCATV